MRQEDLGTEAGVSRGAIARIEQGHADKVTVETLDKVARALGARVVCRLTWNSEGLDRLLDSDHAAIVEQVVGVLRAADWLVATEVSFNVFGERGSIDIFAFHPVARTLLVIEVKSVVPDVQATLVTLDRKERLALEIARQRGWDAVTVAKLLIIRDDRTARRRVEQHRVTFGNAFRIESRGSESGSARPILARHSAGCGFCQANLRRSRGNGCAASSLDLSVARSNVPDTRLPHGRVTGIGPLTTG
jgi:DNA-binding XRE family transcriptional regulator